ncbi:Cytochrome P450 monooxygenase apf7, partial [Lachnellula suecica]
MEIFNTLREIAFYAFGIILSLGLFILTCEFALHPLKKYPGPFIAKFTDGYGGYFAVKKRLHLATYRDHLSYANRCRTCPVFRQAPNRLIFNTSSALRDIYLNPGMNKAHIYRHTQFNPQVNIFGTLDRERHRQKRKIYGQVLSERSLRTFEPIMIGEIDIFVRQLLITKSKSVNMSPLCERLTTDIAGQLAFGQPFDTQVDVTNRIFPRAMISMNGIVNTFLSWPSIAKTWPVLKLLNKKGSLAFTTAIQGIIQKRMALPKDAKHDFYSIAAGEVDMSENGLRRSELWAEAVFFLPAGGTTLSAALSAAFFYLSRNPTAYSRLATEIRTTFSSNLDIQSGSKLSGCKYLRAVIDETLRVAPPFVGTFWREPYSDYTQPLVVDGHVIPHGTMVGVNPYCVMHNEKYFPEPFKFQPERWLGPEDGTSGSAEEEQSRAAMRAAFAPFALGDTGCLGKAMAYHETGLVLAKTLWYFDFEKAPGAAGKLGEGQPGRRDGRDKVDEYQLFDLAVADHDGPNLVFIPRGNHLDELN